MNSVQSVFCSECGGQLLSSAGEDLGAADAAPTIKGPNLPAEGTAGEAEPPAAEQESGGPEEGVPAWLRDLAAESEAASQGEDQEDVPTWLHDLRDSFLADEETDVPSPSDWLARLRPVAEDQPPADLAQSQDEKSPDWLAELHSTAGAEATEAAPLEAKEDETGIPEWLAELQSKARAEAAEAAPLEAEADQTGIPEWLAELQSKAGPEAAEAVPLEAQADETGIPEWLAALQSTAGAEAAEAAPLEAEADQTGIPEWLAALQSTAGAEAAEAGKVPGWPAEDEAGTPPSPPEKEAAEPEGIPASAMPDGLQALESAGLVTQASPPMDQDAGGELAGRPGPATEEAEEEGLARAEIPVWILALKPAELREEGEPEGPSPPSGEPVEERGLLAGLRGTLPVEMLIARPRALVAAEPPPVIPCDTAQGRLFADVVGRGPDARPIAIPLPHRRRLGRLPLWIFYLALLGAITLPLLLQDPLFERSIESPASVLDLYESVEALDPSRPALVAFDYDPSSSDEMNILARAVVGHLLDRRIPVVAVTLQPAGLPVAQSVLDELAAGHPGARYANAGYLSGGAAAVQLLGQGLGAALLQDFQTMQPADLPIVHGITSFESFGMLLVLTAEPEGLRVWIEQAGALQAAPLAAAVSASIEPMARPYYETDPRQLLGLVAGVPGAATYETLRSGDGTLPAGMAASLDSQLAGHAVFVLVLVVGNLAYLVRRGPRGRR